MQQQAAMQAAESPAVMQAHATIAAAAAAPLDEDQDQPGSLSDDAMGNSDALSGSPIAAAHGPGVTGCNEGQLVTQQPGRQANRGCGAGSTCMHVAA